MDKDKLAATLWNFVQKFESDDETTHRDVFLSALRAEHYWHNRQHIYRDPSTQIFKEFMGDDELDLYTANIYTANGESIVAAMSSAVPQVNFYPDDADAMDDIITASAYQKIADLIIKQNKAPLLLTRALYILYNQHFAAFWNYTRKSAKYGFYSKKVPRHRDITVQKTICPICESEVQAPEPQICPNCEASITPEVRDIPDVEIFEEDVFEPKSREIVRVFGPMHVRVAPYVQDIEDSPYLILDFESHPTLAMRLYPEHRDKLRKFSDAITDYRREGRRQIYGGDNTNLDTWKCVWLQPWTYEGLREHEDIYNYLSRKFPDGLYLVFVGDVLVEVENQSLEDHWTLTQNPLTNYIYARPLGGSCVSVQDAVNELVNLSMDTIKHGIPQTFASSDILDLEKYSASDVAPGKVWPTKGLPPGSSMSDFIMTTRTATLSQEVKDLYGNLQQLSQLVTGAFPSIYGGILSGSRTASEYSQSRAQALQRLSTIWTMIKVTWAEVIYKACVSFAKNLTYDERNVEKLGNSFINVWIKRAELSGRIGRVEPEPDEGLPVSWAQQRDVIMRMVEINSPLINEVLSMPENAYLIKNALGMRELLIPGYQDKMKQRAEIQELIMGNDIQIDPLLDNHAVESSECRSFLISEVGQDLKVGNPEAYQRVYQHYIAHMQAMTGGSNEGPEPGPEPGI